MPRKKATTPSPNDPEWFKKIPPPKFAIGQQIRHTEKIFFREAGARVSKTLVANGYVVGYWFGNTEKNHVETELGWTYLVYLNDPALNQSKRFSSRNYSDHAFHDFVENEIKAIAPEPPPK